MVTPEIMVKPTTDFRSLLDDRLDALGIGPGLGSARRQDILDAVTRFAGPMVVDADALNALSTDVGQLKNCAGPRLLTPHPGEMSRLWSTSGKSRIEIVGEFTAAFPVTLLLKGRGPGWSKPASYNSTGSPGLATGGSGDVLTGCVPPSWPEASPYDAGRLGTWLCGRAAELAANRSSEESMLPSDCSRTSGLRFTVRGISETAGSPAALLNS
jgi:NAD(P)H-hydrate epimerase